MQNTHVVRKIPTSRPYMSGLLLVTAATVAWSTAGLFTRLIPLDNWTLLVWRGLFGAIAITLVCFVFERRNMLKGFLSLGWAGWLFAVVSAVGMVCFISALTHTTVARVSIVYATVPLVTAGLAWLVLRDKPTKHAMTASTAALIGVAIMVGVANEGYWLGDLLALGMTACLALMMILSRVAPDFPLLPAAAVSALLSSAMAYPFSQSISVEPDQWLLLILFGVVNSALGLTLFILGAKTLPAIETALITALDAPLAPILVWLFFNETPDIATIIGGSIVFIAVAKYLIDNSFNNHRINPQD